MENILIISYFYPPSNFVGGERVNFWAENLSKSNFHPTILTRRWNENQTQLTDKIEELEREHTQEKNHSVHRISHKQLLRDRLSNYKYLSLLRKTLSLIQIFTNQSLIFNRTNRDLFKQAEVVIKNENISTIIISGRPFWSFVVGYKLKKKHNINWIADYRDQWTTYPNVSVGLLSKLIWKFERKNELKWTSNCHSFLCTSEDWKSNISKLINKKGIVVQNGYTELNKKNPIIDKRSPLTLAYTGTLYPEQDLSPLLKILNDFSTSVHLLFIGIETIPKMKKRIQNLLENSNISFEIKDRMNKSSLQKMLLKTDLMILSSFKGVKGWLPVKAYEYYAANKPIIAFPNDSGLINQFIKETNSGFTPSSEKELKQLVKSLIIEKKEMGFIQLKRNIENGYKYSREYQTKILASHLDSIK